MRGTTVICPDPSKRQFSLKQIGLATLAVAIICTLKIPFPSDSSVWLNRLLQSAFAVLWILFYDWPSLHLEKVNRLIANGKIEEARQLCQRYIEHFPKKPEGYCYLGFANLEKAELEEADVNFDKALMQDPNCSRAWIGKGVVRYRNSELEEAKNCFTTARRNEDFEPWANSWLCATLILEGEIEQAQNLAQTYSKVAGFTNHYHSAMGTIKMELGEFATAQHFFNLAYDESKGVGYFAAAVICGFRDGRHSWALEQANALCKAHPENLAALSTKSWILSTCPNAALRDGKEALRLTQSLQKMQNEYDTYVYVAVALAELGRFDEAALAMEEALKTCPEHRRARFQRHLADFQQSRPCRDNGFYHAMFAEPAIDPMK